MKKKISMLISLTIVTGGIFASQDNEARWVMRKAKPAPARSSLFTSNQAEQEVLNDQSERPDAVSFSHATSPWAFASNVQHGSSSNATRRSSLFEPSYAVSQEEHEALELKDMEENSRVFSPGLPVFAPDSATAKAKIDVEIGNLENQEVLKSVATNDNQGNYYFSKSILPWVYGKFKQRDSLLSQINDIIFDKDRNQQELIDLLRGKDLSNITKFNDNPLISAIDSHRKEMIPPLVAAGANVSMKDKDGTDIIKYAYDTNDSAMVQELLKAQSQQMIDSGKVSPLAPRTASVSPYYFDGDQQ